MRIKKNIIMTRQEYEILAKCFDMFDKEGMDFYDLYMAILYDIPAPSGEWDISIEEKAETEF